MWMFCLAVTVDELLILASFRISFTAGKMVKGPRNIKSWYPVEYETLLLVGEKKSLPGEISRKLATHCCFDTRDRA